MRHYIGNAKFEIRNELGERMIVGPNMFMEIPDSFHGDPTYRMGVKAGLIQPFITTKQGDKAEEKANAKGTKNPKNEVKVSTGETANGEENTPDTE